MRRYSIFPTLLCLMIPDTYEIAFLKAMVEEQPGKTIIIDEFQKAPELLDVVHGMLSEKQIQFVLTGSSARKRSRRIFPFLKIRISGSCWNSTTGRRASGLWRRRSFIFSIPGRLGLWRRQFFSPSLRVPRITAAASKSLSSRKYSDLYRTRTADDGCSP